MKQCGFMRGYFLAQPWATPCLLLPKAMMSQATWSGSIQWVIGDNSAKGYATSAVKGFDLRIDFEQTAIRGVVRRLEC